MSVQVAPPSVARGVGAKHTQRYEALKRELRLQLRGFQRREQPKQHSKDPDPARTRPSSKIRYRPAEPSSQRSLRRKL